MFYSKFVDVAKASDYCGAAKSRLGEIGASRKAEVGNIQERICKIVNKFVEDNSIPQSVLQAALLRPTWFKVFF